MRTASVSAESNASEAQFIESPVAYMSYSDQTAASKDGPSDLILSIGYAQMRDLTCKELLARE